MDMGPAPYRGVERDLLSTRDLVADFDQNLVVEVAVVAAADFPRERLDAVLEVDRHGSLHPDGERDVVLVVVAGRGARVDGGHDAVEDGVHVVRAGREGRMRARVRAGRLITTLHRIA